MNGYFRAAPTFLYQKQDHAVLLPQRSTVFLRRYRCCDWFLRS
jgi:hypothetical protein